MVLRNLRDLKLEKKGFSLLELLLATVLLSIGLVGLVNVFSIGLTESSQAKYFSVAKNLAEEKLEEIRNLSYGNILDQPTRESVSGFPDFERQVHVSNAQDNLKNIQIDVFWQDKAGEVSISVYSLVSDI
jgi:prepilin-type N-terminal cleavage/methylation domain-containing protein